MDTVTLTLLSCDGCGFCCHLQSRPPFLPSELDRLPPALAHNISDQVLGPDDFASGPCIWLSPEGRCGHYQDRPSVCREFELNSQDCLEIRRERGL